MATIPQYEVGDKIVIETTFKDEAGALTNPGTVAAEYRKPSGSAPVTVGTTNPSTGVFRITMPVFDEAGFWKWYIAGTAGLIAADQGVVRVVPKSTA